MISSKEDYLYYLESDRISLQCTGGGIIRRFIDPDYIWNFLRLLRKVEYLSNRKQTIFDLITYALEFRRFKLLSLKLGFYIHPNNFGPGLRIVHPGMLIVNPEARIGANCHIFNGVVIGMEHRYYSGDAPVIGNNIYIGPGAKIFGPITIADNIAIGVNAVVNKSFMEPGITIAGVPARKISDKGSEKLITKGSEIARIRMSSHTR